MHAPVAWHRNNERVTQGFYSTLLKKSIVPKSSSSTMNKADTHTRSAEKRPALLYTDDGIDQLCPFFISGVQQELAAF